MARKVRRKTTTKRRPSRKSATPARRSRRARRTKGSNDGLMQTIVIVAVYEFLSKFISDAIEKAMPTLFTNANKGYFTPGILTAVGVYFLADRVAFLKKFPQLKVVTIAYITKHLMSEMLVKKAGTTSGIIVPTRGINMPTSALPKNFKGYSMPAKTTRGKMPVGFAV